MSNSWFSDSLSHPWQRTAMKPRSLALSVPPRTRIGGALLAASVALLPIFVTIAFWSTTPGRYQVNERADFFSYYSPVAKNIADGRGMIVDGGGPAIEYPPLQPLALAATYASAKALDIDETAALRFLILGCLTWSCLALAALARRIWNDVGAVAVAVSWCTYPLTLWLTKQPNSELLFTACLTTGVALLIPSVVGERRAPGWWFAAGSAIGAAMLVRAIALLLPVVVCGIVLWRARVLAPRARVLACCLFLAGVGTVTLPWEAWVYRQVGVIVPLSGGGAAAMKDGFTFGIERRDYREGITVPTDVAEFMEPIEGQRMRTSGDVVVAVARQARAHPVAAVKLAAIKLARAWYGTDSERLDSYILALQCLYLSILIIATIRAWQLGGAPRELSLTLWSIVGCFWAMNLLSLPLARYMTPAIGLLFLLVPALLTFQSSTPNAQPGTN